MLRSTTMVVVSSDSVRLSSGFDFFFNFVLLFFSS